MSAKSVSVAAAVPLAESLSKPDKYAEAVAAARARRGRRASGTTGNDNKAKQVPSQSSSSQFEEMKRRRRSKSPFKRLLHNISRSPLRKSRKHGEANLQHGDAAPDLDPTAAVEDESSTQGYGDYIKPVEYMVDPVGELRLKRYFRAGMGTMSASSSYTSRSDSLFDSDASSLNSWRSRDVDSIGSSRDSRHDRPLPTKIDLRTPKHREGKHKPHRVGRGLSVVKEDALTSSQTMEERKERAKSAPRSRPVHNNSNTQVVWKKYAEPEKKAPTRRSNSAPRAHSGASNASLCSDGSLVTRVLLLLLHPESKFFEIIQLVFTPETSTIGDLLDSIPAQATEAKLIEQQYIGLVRAVRHSVPWTERSQPASEAYVKKHSISAAGIIPGDVLVAIPRGYTRRHVLRLGIQILDSPRIKKLLVDKFRSEMHVPTTITMLPPTTAPSTERVTPGILKTPSRRSTKDTEKVESSVSQRTLARPRLPPSDESVDGTTRTPTRRNPRRVVDLEEEDDLFPSLPMSAPVYVSSEQRVQTPPAAEIWNRDPCVSPPTQASEMTKTLERAVVQPILSQSLLTADAIYGDDSTTRSDAIESPLVETPESAQPIDGHQDRIEMDPDGNELVPTETVVGEFVKQAAETKADEFYNDDDDQHAASQQDIPETSPPPPPPGSTFANLSPVRRRIHELEEKIAVNPTVPLPAVGPRDFRPESSKADDGDDQEEEEEEEEENLPGLVGTMVGKCNSEDSPELNADALDERGLDVDSLHSMGLAEEHREILRKALAHIDSLPTPVIPTLDLFTKCRSLSMNDSSRIAGDETAAAHYSIDRRVQDSIDDSYSAWSRSVESSLVSRYSLLSHSSTSLLSTEEARASQAQAKMRLRRRQKAKFKRSLKKLGVTSLAIILFLYWADYRGGEDTTVDGMSTLNHVHSPLGVLGILQFVVALCTLVKVQYLWKKSTAIIIQNESCPFLMAVQGLFGGSKSKSK